LRIWTPWLSDEPEWQQEHLAAWVLAVFAGLALALAAAGLHSIVSYAVLLRTGKFGIRLLLGAARGHVLGIVFASKIAVLGGGTAAGLAFVIAWNRVSQSWAQATRRDPTIPLIGTAFVDRAIGNCLRHSRTLRLPD